MLEFGGGERRGAEKCPLVEAFGFLDGNVGLSFAQDEAIADRIHLVPVVAERPLRLPSRRRVWLSVGILGAAVAAVVAGVPADVAFAAGVLAAMVTRVVYTAIDWPVIVLPSPGRVGWGAAMRFMRDRNWIRRDGAIKRHMGFDDAYFQRAATVLKLNKTKEDSGAAPLPASPKGEEIDRPSVSYRS